MIAAISFEFAVIKRLTCANDSQRHLSKRLANGFKGGMMHNGESSKVEVQEGPGLDRTQ
jgi:hypothetical protein